jgi:hypothetical protein
VTPLLPRQMSGPLFPTGFCPDIGSHTVHPALARCPEPRPFGGRDGGLWEWSDLSCHSLVGSFKIEFFFFCFDEHRATGGGGSERPFFVCRSVDHPSCRSVPFCDITTACPRTCLRHINHKQSCHMPPRHSPLN